MRGFLYGVYLQWKLDIRSKTMLITCYLVPLLFFAMMGGIFSATLPERALIPSMTVFGVTMGALIGLPPSLVEIYGTGVQKVYRANGVPRCLGLVLTNLSGYIHLLIMSGILYLAAPVAFSAEAPAHPGLYFGGLALFTAVSLSVASVIGLAVKDQAKTPMVSLLIFLPSIMLSGILFPIALLPPALAALGKLFPATWAYRLITGQGSALWPLLAMLLVAVALNAVLLHKTGKTN